MYSHTCKLLGTHLCQLLQDLLNLGSMRCICLLQDLLQVCQLLLSCLQARCCTQLCCRHVQLCLVLLQRIQPCCHSCHALLLLRIKPASQQASQVSRAQHLNTRVLGTSQARYNSAHTAVCSDTSDSGKAAAAAQHSPLLLLLCLLCYGCLTCCCQHSLALSLQLQLCGCHLCLILCQLAQLALALNLQVSTRLFIAATTTQACQNTVMHSAHAVPCCCLAFQQQHVMRRDL
jgi:hypothetical protein